MTKKMNQHHKLLIIGSGSAAYSVAIYAARVSTTVSVKYWFRCYIGA